MAARTRTIGLQIQVLNARTIGEIYAAFSTLGREQPNALFVGLDAFLNSRRTQLVNLAARHALPASYAARCRNQNPPNFRYLSMIILKICRNATHCPLTV